MIRWNGADVALNDDESDFLAGLKDQHDAGTITSEQLSTQVKTLMRLKTSFDASMLDEKDAKELGFDH